MDWGALGRVISSISGWVTAAITGAGAFVLLVDEVQGVSLIPLRAEYGSWILLVTIVASFLTVAKFCQFIQRSIAEWLLARRKAVRELADLEKREAAIAAHRRSVLAHLDTLSPNERRALSIMVSTNRRTASAPVMHSVASMLKSKGLLEIPEGVYTAFSFPFTIPGFVWEELQQRKAEFNSPTHGDPFTAEY